MLLRGKLDISLIASCSYLTHQDQLQIIPVMSVHSVGPSLSSIVVSRTNRGISAGDAIAVTGHAETSVKMLQIILEDSNITARLERFQDLHGWDLLDKAPFALLIGDDALRARTTDLNITLDIGQAWWEMTSSPAVFAVSAIKSSLRESKKEITRASDLLRKAVESRRETIQNVITEDSLKYSLPEGLLSEYFERIRLDFNGSVRRGLRELIERVQKLNDFEIHGFQ